jgi:isopentenyl-diphosphate delta-isomerase
MVVLCDPTGRPTGSSDLLTAHTGEGLLHLAFSVYIFSPDRHALLIQQRSQHKMLWPLVWANTCCSHPQEGDDIAEVARRRLEEEMGISCDLTRGPEFVYRAIWPQNRGVEHELDVTFWGAHEGPPSPNPEEVAAWRWLEVEELRREMRLAPEQFAPWLHLGLEQVMAHQART